MCIYLNNSWEGSAVFHRLADWECAWLKRPWEMPVKICACLELGVFEVSFISAISRDQCTKVAFCNTLPYNSKLGTSDKKEMGSTVCHVHLRSKSFSSHYHFKESAQSYWDKGQSPCYLTLLAWEMRERFRQEEERGTHVELLHLQGHTSTGRCAKWLSQYLQKILLLCISQVLCASPAVTPVSLHSIIHLSCHAVIAHEQSLYHHLFIDESDSSISFTKNASY